MCGILLVAGDGAQVEQTAGAFESRLKARGPDHFGALQVDVPHSSTVLDSSNVLPSQHNYSTHNSTAHLLLHLAASLLQLRGQHPSTSPLVDSDGNVLCFNGEIYSGLDITPGGNDGKALLLALQQAASAGAAADSPVDPGTATQHIADTASSVHTDSLHAAERAAPRPSCSTGPSRSGTSPSSSASPSSSGAGRLMGVLSRLRGPWSLLYWQQQQQALWFGRDVMGKRSVLLQACSCSTPGRAQHGDQHQGHQLILASVAPAAQHQQQGLTAPAEQAIASSGLSQQQQQEPNSWPGGWLEVPPGVYSILAQDLLHSLSVRGSRPHHCGSNSSSHAQATSDACSLQDGGGPRFLPAHMRPAEAAAAAGCAEADAGNSSVQTPQDMCALLPGLVHHQWTDPQLQQLQEYARGIGVVQGAAEPMSSSQQQPTCQLHAAEDATCSGSSTHWVDGGQQAMQQDVQEASAALQHLQLQPSVQQQVLACCQVPQQAQQPALEGAGTLGAASQQLLQLLQAAVDVRCMTINTLCQQQQQQQQQPCSVQPVQAGLAGAAAALPPAPVLILFSGGVDSTLIAALAHRALPPGVPIDLSNVCFDSGRSADRVAARAAVLELAAYAPDRPWRLIEVDSSLQEVDELSQHIKGLLQPACTVMDWNIGSALWLAAKAEGRVWVPSYEAGLLQQHAESHGSLTPAPMPATASSQVHDKAWRLLLAYGDATCVPPAGFVYRSAARVVLLGHGADEQCGGYGRHRTRFREAGWQGVADEVALDVRRLWLRNLGRDDRLVADHGREGRHPFLDEDVMSFLLKLPLQLMVDYSKPPGVGDKCILRHLLASLGLPEAAAREKRAIQFGSRIGQLSNKRDFGSNRQANKKQAGSLKMDVGSGAHTDVSRSRTFSK